MCLTEAFLVLTELCLFISAPTAPLGDRDMDRDSIYSYYTLFVSLLEGLGRQTRSDMRRAEGEDAQQRLKDD